MQPTAVLLVADADDSLVSRAVPGALDAGLADLLEVRTVDEADGRAQLGAGEASGLLLVPSGFGDAVLRDEPVTLELLTNPAQQILPRIIEEGLDVLLDGVFYVRAVAGEEMDTVVGWVDAGAEVEAADVASLAVAIRERLQSATAYLFPLAFTVDVADPETEGEVGSLALLFVPGVVLMSVMLAASTLANDWWRERELNTLRRFASTPQVAVAGPVGKALAAGLVIASVSAVPLALGFLYHGLGWSRLPLAVLWIGISGAALFAWFSVLQMLASTKRAATAISSIIVFPLLMAGGSFFPFEALPGWIAALGRLTPNGFVADRLSMQMLGPSAWSIDAGSWIGVVAIGGRRDRRLHMAADDRVRAALRPT